MCTRQVSLETVGRRTGLRKSDWKAEAQPRRQAREPRAKAVMCGVQGGTESEHREDRLQKTEFGAKSSSRVMLGERRGRGECMVDVIHGERQHRKAKEREGSRDRLTCREREKWENNSSVVCIKSVDTPSAYCTAGALLMLEE